MKKLLTVCLVLILSLTLCFGLVACGGGKAPSSEQTSSEPTPETTFAATAFGDITISVPNVFSAVSEMQGSYVSAGPGSSIVVTPAIEVELLPTDWDEELVQASLEGLYGATYTNMELAAYENDVNMNGNTAMYFGFTGTNAEGVDRLVQVVYLFNADLTQQYIITFVTTVGDSYFTSEINETIINSITLAK